MSATDALSAWPEFCSPSTGSSLREDGDAYTSQDGERFPIVGGVATFVTSHEYAEHFGWQWNRFPKTQLDSYTGFPISENRLRKALGERLWNALPGSKVLECGCGAGRFTEILLKQGALVTSVDLSSAVEANVRNCPISAQHRVAKADIMHLPFQPQKFDIVICLGVIQHTPDPEKTIASLYNQVRPGGDLVIDHYTFEKGRWTSIKPFVRAYLKRQPAGKTVDIVEKLVDRFLPWHRRFKSFYPAWFVLCRFSPIVTFYRMMPEFPDSLHREWAFLDSHDSLTDWYKHLRTKDQIHKTLQDLGMEDIHTEYSGNGVEGRGRRPLK